MQEQNSSPLEVGNVSPWLYSLRVGPSNSVLDFNHSACHLRQHLTWHRLAKYIFPHDEYTWYKLPKLSYTDAVLMRVGYVLSYILLLAFESMTIAAWLQQLPASPRSVLVAGVVLSLGVLYSIQSLPEPSQTPPLQ